MSEWTVPGYSELGELGNGMAGKVVEAVHDATGNSVAIKYIRPALVRDPGFMWKFRTDAQALRQLRVPQVVQVQQYVERAGQGAALVMELVNGLSLRETIKRRGPVGPEAALAVLKDSLYGLAAAHGVGLFHRDYKPENVLVDTGGRSKLTDFGVAVWADAHVQAGGPPPYMAPEQWNGAPNSPATDIYAATAVFFECLTGHPPFSGNIDDLGWQHNTAAVPLDRVDEPLRPLIAHGMAKQPTVRPQSALAFAAELDAAAAAAYGAGWEERGRRQLAKRGVRNRRRRRRILAVTAIAAVPVLAIAAIAGAVVVSGKDHQASLSAVMTAPFKAVANVTPPVVASKCNTATAFTYSGELTAAAPGTVSYQWVYSTGKQAPVQTVSFTAPGQTKLTGETVKTATAGGGWAEIKLISPVAQTSDKASYQLVCSGGVEGIYAAAAVQPVAATSSCATGPEAFTATGSIRASKAEKIEYYWWTSAGERSAAATLTFTGPGTQAAQPFTFTPAGTGSGQAALVVVSPVSMASSSATYTVSCQGPALKLAAAASPASQALTSCTAAEPTITFTGTIADSKAGTVSYHWQLPSGAGPTQTLTFGQAGTEAVAKATYKPASDSASGSGTIVVTSPGSVSSNAAAFKLTCPTATPLSVSTTGAPATATIGKAYSGTVTATGGKSPYTWSATGLPTGLTMSASGAITGTPTKAGSYSVTVSVKDSSSPAQTAKATITITVSVTPLAITTSAPATATIGTAYSGTVTATGGTSPFTWSATSLPPGLTMSATGAITGTPTTAGSYTATVTVKDSSSPALTATAIISIVVSAAATATPTT
jgi:eukaryotic-like serine/threonine-protein kinase